jgi:nitroreductase
MLASTAQATLPGEQELDVPSPDLATSSPDLEPVSSIRTADADIDEAFLNRWSSRAFSLEPIAFEKIRTLFEAARFTPSAGNVQPWLFIYAADASTRRRARTLLNEEHRRWADRAPLLVFVFARRTHPQTGADLRTGAFDTGAAWFALALQAEKLGLSCRAMGGMLHERAYSVLGVPEAEFTSMIAVAIGYRGESGDLPPDLAERDRPSPRKRQHEFVFNGRYIERDPSFE